MVAEILQEGFARAHRRFGLVFLDVIWKLVWSVLTISGLVVVLYRFVSRFEFEPINIQVLDALRIANSVQQLWSDYGAELVVGLIVVACMSAFVYVLLEATVRRKLVGAGFSPRSGSNKTSSVELERGLKPASTSVLLFLGTNLAKLIILGSTATCLSIIANGSREALIAGVVAFVALAFFLTIIDTLVRADSIELLGADFLGVLGLIGTLMLFESFIGASLLVAVIAGFLNVANANQAVQMVIATALVLLVLNFLHSYLLIVRFSAVGIMKRNVIDV